MFRITRNYLLRLMLGAAVLPVSSCTAHTTKDEKSMESSQSSEQIAAANAAQDRSIFDAKIAIAEREGYAKLQIGDRVVAMGKLLLGIPYVGGTLEVDSLNEVLVTNLRGLDCVTFYENSLALARSLKSNDTARYPNYLKQLTLLRYRNGERTDFASRLHYSSDYFFDNVKKGTMRNVTNEVGAGLATRDTRVINFMSTHPNAYKQIKANPEQLAKIKAVEADMQSRGGYAYIAKADVAKIEQNIQNGDILGIVTSINGLDMSHTGIAMRDERGVLHFMHASSALGKVVISEGSLSEYLAPNAKQIGVVVMRPIEVATN